MATWKKVVVESAADTITQDTTGNAATATALETSRNFSIDGDITAASVGFDGTGNVTLSATIDADVVGANELLVQGNGTSGQLLSSEGDGSFAWVDASSNTNDATITLSAGAGIANIGDFTTNQSSNETLTIGVDGVLEDLDTLGSPASDGEFIVATGYRTFAYESGATVRTSLGLGTGDSPTFTDLTLTGDLIVSGTTTTINTSELHVEDKLIKIADVATPTTTTANGAGIQVESSATEAEWPEFKWSNSANLTGWQLSDHNATSSTMFEVAVMEFGTAAPSSPDIETEAGAGAFFADTTGGNLYLYI
jgi:hypothetical protein